MKKTEFEKPAFMGMVTASVSHDLQNVLAIIKETSGLMQDILLMGRNSVAPEMAEKFAISIARVQKQAERGVEITSALNGFAHTADSLKDSVGIADIIQRVVFLTRRVFLHKGLTIEINDVEDVLTIETDPVLFQMLVYKCLQYIGGDGSESSVLEISAGRKVGAAVTVSREGVSAAESGQQERWQELCLIAERLDVTLENTDEYSGVLILL